MKRLCDHGSLEFKPITAYQPGTLEVHHDWINLVITKTIIGKLMHVMVLTRGKIETHVYYTQHTMMYTLKGTTIRNQP